MKAKSRDFWLDPRVGVEGVYMGVFKNKAPLILGSPGLGFRVIWTNY